MFRGATAHTLDDKGRIVIPARFRDAIKQNGGGVMVTRMDGALWAYTYPEWDKVEEKLMAQTVTSAAMRRFRRFFIGSATDCRCDKQGRILISPELRQRAGLQRDLMLVGQLDHFEIWDKALYEADDEQLERDMKDEEVRNEIAALGL
jgi:MraZ protein